MRINSFEAVNFKCLNGFKLDFSDFLNIIVGPNASGKTSCLDCIYYLFVLRSTSLTRGVGVIGDFASEALIKGRVEDEKGKKNKIVLISKHSQKTSIDGVETTKSSEFTSDAAIISFNNDDVFSVTGAPLDRRKMMNIVFCQSSNEYAELLKSYRNIVKEKNSLLKSKGEIDRNLFDVFSSQQFDLMIRIEQLRSAFVEKLNCLIKHYHNVLSSGKEEAQLLLKQNVASDKSKDDFMLLCQKDLQFKTCTCGCHRDDYQFIIDNHLINNRASQGQIKTITLAYKMACLDFLEESKGTTPIILLDDVFGELDKERQNALLEMLQRQGNQVFITTPSLADINEHFIKNANIINLEKGGTTHGQ